MKEYPKYILQSVVIPYQVVVRVHLLIKAEAPSEEDS